MKVFILEDNELRIKYFNDKLKAYDINIANNVKDGKKILLKEEKWDLILLDHDLDGRVFVDSYSENTGYRLAKFIKENNIKYDRVILHTMNSVGAANMKAVLEDAEVIPFYMLTIMED